METKPGYSEKQLNSPERPLKQGCGKTTMKVVIRS
jgi:hypothetical protein